jgi:hypothetical protein
LRKQERINIVRYETQRNPYITFIECDTEEEYQVILEILFDIMPQKIKQLHSPASKKPKCKNCKSDKYFIADNGFCCWDCEQQFNDSKKLLEAKE